MRLMWLSFLLTGTVLANTGTVSVCRFFNDSVAAVVISSDDYQASTYLDFGLMADVCRSNHIVLSAGVIAGLTTPAMWSDLQRYQNTGFISVQSHSYNHNANVTASNIYTEAANEVTNSFAIINSTMTNMPFMRYNGTNHCLAWAEPGSAFSADMRLAYYTNLTAIGVLVGRSDAERGNEFGAWNTDFSRGIYYEAPVGINSSNYSAHVTLFDQCIASNLIYSAYNHGWRDHVKVHDPWYNILQYVGNRPNVWYSGLGELYSYDFVASNVVISLTENTTNSVISVSIDESLRATYGVGSYPVTFKYQFSSNWKFVREVQVQCVQNGTTNILPNKTKYEFFSGQNAVRIDSSGGCAYISQAFAETGTNYTMVVTPVSQGIPRYK